MTLLKKVSLFGIAVIILLMTDISYSQDEDPSTVPPTPDDGSCKVGTKKCVDCSTLSKCIKLGNSNTNLNISCKAQSPTKPFCDTTLNECTNNESLCNITTANDDVCTIDEGYLPDAKTCRRYYYCYTEDGKVKAESKACPANFAYDPITQVCDRNAACYDFTSTGLCRGKGGQFVVHPTAKSIYALCSVDPNEASIVLICPGSYQFNAASVDCAPVCTQKGRIPNEEDCKKFFVCDKNGNTFIPTPDTCPGKLTFNRDKGICDSSKASCDDETATRSKRAFFRLAKISHNLRRKRDNNDGVLFPLFENF